MKKAVLYVRVSTKEQAEQGYSLDGQEKECRLFAENHELAVDTVFVERGESAKTQNRTELQNLIRYCRSNKGAISALIVWKIDRLSRNIRDMLELSEFFKNLQIQVLSATENNEVTSMGRFIRNFMGVLSQFDNDQRAERTANGMRQALENGYWCGRAPVGYKNTRIDGHKAIAPDENAPLIKEAFLMAASGNYYLESLRKHLRCKGLNLTSQAFHKIMQNPLYAGLIKTKWQDDPVPAKHEPLVSQEVFYKAQHHLYRKKKPSSKKRLKFNKDFPLRGLLHCPKCSSKLRAGFSTGRHGGKFGYYFCPGKLCQVSVKKQWVESEFLNLLDMMCLKPEIIEELVEMIRTNWTARNLDDTSGRQALTKKLTGLKAKRSRLTDYLADGTIDRSSYREQIGRINEDIALISDTLNDENKEASIDIEACIAWCQTVLGNLKEFWTSAPPDLGVQYFNLIFPLGLMVDKEGYRTPINSPLFNNLQPVSPQKINFCIP